VKSIFVVHDLTKPTRLDRLLRNQFPTWGRQAVQQLISRGKVQVNGRVVWLASWTVQNRDRIEVWESPTAKPEPPMRFDDSWLIEATAELVVVNKPAGLLSEPTRWGQGVNLRDLASARFGSLLLFHRLDRDTSGVVLLTRPGLINQYLDHAFKTHRVRKEYMAVVQHPNQLAAKGVIEERLAPDPQRRDRMGVTPRGGQPAVTRYQVERTSADRQWVRLWPETGRTHQLRVHLAHLGAPIWGDRLYGPQPPTVDRLLLHALRLELPDDGNFPARTYSAPLPGEFGQWVGKE
jgi:RluA family pseudouridine synthase